MPTTGQLIVKFVTQGYQQVTSALHATEALAKGVLKTFKDVGTISGIVGKAFGNLRDRVNGVAAVVDGLGNRFSTLGNRAALGFAGAVAAMGKLLSVADPTGWRMFTTQLQILSLHLGRIFIPILRDATQWVRNLWQYFKGLSPETRQQIVNWTRFALVGLVVGAVLAKIGGALLGIIASMIGTVAATAGLVASLFSGIAALFGFTAAEAVAAIATSILSGGLWLIVMAVAALVAGLVVLTAGLALAAAALFVMGQKGQTIGEKLANAWKQITTTLKPFFAIFMEFVRRLSNELTALGQVVGEVVGEILSSFGSDWQGLWEVAQAVFSVFLSFVLSGIHTMSIGLLGLLVVAKHIIAAMQHMSAAAALFAKGLITASPFEKQKIADQIGKEMNAAGKEMNPLAIATDVKEKIDGFNAKVDAANNGPQKLEDNTPMVFPHKPELLGVAEAMRRAQTAVQNDPRIELQKEQRDLQRQANKNLKDIVDNTAKQPKALLG